MLNNVLHLLRQVPDVYSWAFDVAILCAVAYVSLVWSSPLVLDTADLLVGDLVDLVMTYREGFKV